MVKDQLLIIGSSGHSKVIVDIFEKLGNYQIVGLIDDYRVIGEETLGYKIVGGLEQAIQILKERPKLKLFIAIGDNWARQKIWDKIISEVPDLDFPNAIHPSTILGRNVKLGKGIACMAGSIINSEAILEDFTFINTNASADHDVVMQSFSSLSPNVTVGGNVTIGEFSSIAIGANIKEKLKIGKHSIIGAGSLLLKDCPDNVIMYGVPAKFVRKRAIGEKYI
jgi:sugar O-acyltransferase (sialic acid O-acetyltransferase NeuD family)